MENNLQSGSEKSRKRRTRCSIVSLVLAAAPLAVTLAVFLACLFFALFVEGAGSVIWWVMIAMVPILGPVTIVTCVLAVIFGIIGLKGRKTVLAWSGIAVVILEVLIALLILGWLLL